MPVLGTPFLGLDLVELMIRTSTNIHKMHYDIKSIVSQMNKFSDANLQEIFQAKGSATPAQDVADFRAWLLEIDGYANNYTGGGVLSDKSTEIAKRVKLQL